MVEYRAIIKILTIHTALGEMRTLPSIYCVPLYHVPISADYAMTIVVKSSTSGNIAKVQPKLLMFFIS